MKLLRNFMGLLALMALSLTAQAQTFQMYTPMGVPSFMAKIVFSLEVVTPAGVYTGTYQSHNPYMLQVGNLDLISWNGTSSIPAPTIYLDHSDEKDISFCPGLAGIPSTNGRGWDCYAADLKVTVTGEVQGGRGWYQARLLLRTKALWGQPILALNSITPPVRQSR